MNYFALVPVVLTPLIALSVYLYKNRIAFDVIVISGSPKENDPDLKIVKGYGRIHAERLTIKNFGIRSLENVELHFAMPSEPSSITVAEPSTISKSAVTTDWSAKVLKINVPTLPSGEELKIDLLRVGNYELSNGRLRGTGGKYKIVDLRTYQLKRGAAFWGIIGALWVFGYVTQFFP